MQTISSKLKVLAAVLVFGGGLVGCEGGVYDANTGRVTFPGSGAASASASAASGSDSSASARSASAYGAPDSQGSTALAAQAPAGAAGSATPAEPIYPIDPSADTSAFNRTPPAPAVGPNGERAAKPELAAVSPAAGPAEGGTEVTITGSGFANVQVMWGGEAARVTSQSSNAVTVLVPQGSAGTITTVVVTNRDGTYAVRPAAFRYM
ncbi:MAG: IPT/TIG domain-containing protein [Anaeromyxobacteraceae bacterium]